MPPVIEFFAFRFGSFIEMVLEYTGRYNGRLNFDKFTLKFKPNALINSVVSV